MRTSTSTVSGGTTVTLTTSPSTSYPQNKSAGGGLGRPACRARHRRAPRRPRRSDGDADLLGSRPRRLERDRLCRRAVGDRPVGVTREPDHTAGREREQQHEPGDHRHAAVAATTPRHGSSRPLRGSELVDVGDGLGRRTRAERCTRLDRHAPTAWHRSPHAPRRRAGTRWCRRVTDGAEHESRSTSIACRHAAGGGVGGARASAPAPPPVPPPRPRTAPGPRRRPTGRA